MNRNETFTISADEMTLTGCFGTIYEAQYAPPTSCMGCAFFNRTCYREVAINDIGSFCTSLARKDGRSVIWVEKVAGASCSHDDEPRGQDAPATVGGAQ